MISFGQSLSLFREAEYVLRYVVVGLLNAALDFCIFFVLVRELGVDIVYANVTSYGTVMCISFILNRKWTFQIDCENRRMGRQFARFAAVNLVALGVSTGSVYAFFL